jgi:cyclophilin family peptidyl-prolyl cis-trans isomerase
MLFGWISAWRKRRAKQAGKAARKARGQGPHHLRFESLEDRNLLSVTMGPITTGANNGSAFTVTSGKDLYVPLPGADAGQTVTYTASSSNSSVIATVMPSSNPTLTLNVTGGTGSSSFSGAMTFELFGNITPTTVANLVNEVNSGAYVNDASFYRILQTAPFQVIQGGNQLNAVTLTFASALGDTSAGSLTLNIGGQSVTAQGASTGAGLASNLQTAINAQLGSGAVTVTNPTGTTIQIKFNLTVTKTTTQTANTLGNTISDIAGSPIADEFSSALTFNSPGLLAMANAGPGTASSEFFITAPGIAQTSMPNTNWDYQYAIFGELTSGFDIYNKILSTPLTTNPGSGENSSPVSPVTITSASISNTTTQAGVVQISEPSDFTGSATITVTATGSDSTTAQQTFTVSAAAPSASLVTGANAIPIVLTSTANNSSTTLVTSQSTPVSFQVSASIISTITGGAYTFSVLPASSTFADPPFTSTTGNNAVSVTVIPSGSTATITLTPASSFTGTLNLTALVNYSVTLGSNASPSPFRDSLPFTLTVTPSLPTVASSTGAVVNAAQAGNTTATVSVTYQANNGGTINAASFGTGNITVFNGSTQAPVTGFSVAGNTVTYTVSAPAGTWGNSSQGTYAINIVAGSVTDNSNNGIAATTASATLVVDTVAPTATISLGSGQANPTSTTPVVFTVNFSVPVTGFSASGITLGGTSGGSPTATVTASDSTGQNYTVSVSNIGNSGTLTATVNANAASDKTGGNGNTVSNTSTVTFNSAPTASLASPLSNINVSGASATTTTVQVTYGDSATNVLPDPTTYGVGNISVTNGSTTATVTGFSVSGNTVTYTVAAPGGTWGNSAQGTYTVAVTAGGVKDANGNSIAASTLGTFVVGTVAPTVTITPASPSTTATSAIFNVVFSEAVTGFTASGLTIGGSAPGTLVAAVSGSGTTYTVTVTGMTGSGTVTAAVKASAAQDAAGNNNTASTTASVTFTVQFFNFDPTTKTLTITGTNTFQTLMIEFADATDFTAQIGGSSQTFSTTQVSTINFNGNGTAATSVFAAPGATMGTVSASLVPGGGQIKGPTYTISISGAATNYFYGNSTSSLSFTDSSGSNSFIANHSYAYMEPSNSSSYFNFAEGFGMLSATPGSGTTDTAYFISASGDSVVDTATYGSIAGNGVFYAANNFPTVYAFGSATGGDTAWLYGTATGFSAFVGNSAYAYMQGIQIGASGNTNYFNSMIGFHNVQAIINSGGLGVATLNGLGSNPEFAAGAGAAIMVGGGIQDSVQGFQTINANANNSSAIALVDGIATHGNSLVRNNGVPALVNGVYTVSMTGFAQVRQIKNLGTGSVPATAADFVLGTIQNWSSLANG